MRMIVITDEDGNVVGAAGQDVGGRSGSGTGGPGAGPGQTVHVVDVPDELAEVDDVGEFHDGLRGLVQ
jgi:hypothetical protein